MRRGWPVQNLLNADLSAGVVNITVFPLDVEQNVTRFSTDWMQIPSPPITLTMPVTGQTVIVGGRPCCPLNAAVIVDGNAFIYPLQARDTLTSVATALAALIRPYTPAFNSGAVITLPDAKTIQTRLGTVANIVQEVKRRKKASESRSGAAALMCATP